MSDGVTRCAEFAGFVDASTIKKQKNTKTSVADKTPRRKKIGIAFLSFCFLLLLPCSTVLLLGWQPSHWLGEKAILPRTRGETKNVE